MSIVWLWITKKRLAKEFFYVVYASLDRLVPPYQPSIPSDASWCIDTNSR